MEYSDDSVTIVGIVTVVEYNEQNVDVNDDEYVVADALVEIAVVVVVVVYTDVDVDDDDDDVNEYAVVVVEQLKMGEVCHQANY